VYFASVLDNGILGELHSHRSCASQPNYAPIREVTCHCGIVTRRVHDYPSFERDWINTRDLMWTRLDWRPIDDESGNTVSSAQHDILGGGHVGKLDAGIARGCDKF